MVKKNQNLSLPICTLIVLLSGCIKSDMEKCRDMVSNARMECAASGEEQIACTEKALEGIKQCNRLYNKEFNS